MTYVEDPHIELPRHRPRAFDQGMAGRFDQSHHK